VAYPCSVVLVGATFTHPTVSEAVLDAARAVDGWAIHA
jgi:hypothetical protein